MTKRKVYRISNLYLINKDLKYGNTGDEGLNEQHRGFGRQESVQRERGYLTTKPCMEKRDGLAVEWAGIRKDPSRTDGPCPCVEWRLVLGGPIPEVCLLALSLLCSACQFSIKLGSLAIKLVSFCPQYIIFAKEPFLLLEISASRMYPRLPCHSKVNQWKFRNYLDYSGYSHLGVGRF